MINQTTTINVRKNNGDLVPFDIEKLKGGLRHSGAGDHEINRVIEKLEDELYDGITTKKIYSIAYRILYKHSHRTAGRYRLKKALQQMGPTGYPFEHFVSRLIESQGYKVETGVQVLGRCVTHEVDVIGRKEGKILMAECKFHRSESAKNDVKISLYVHSRMQDIEAKLKADNELENAVFEPLLVTNTRFTEDAEQYGICSGMRLISWDFPFGKSLKDMIDKSGFHPITTMKSLTQKEKEELMQEGIVLCSEVAAAPQCLDKFHIPDSRRKRIIREAKAIV